MTSAQTSSAASGAPRPATGDADAIIVGAGPAGLACAAMMRKAGLSPLILEKRDAVGAMWRRYYDCLHLHTERAFSALPGLPMPRTYPRFPSRQQVVEYLEAYAETFDIRPVYGAEVRAITRNGAGWEADCGAWSATAPVAVVAAGLASFPHQPDYPGREDYAGSIIHSLDYRNPARYAGQRVLVIGFGNSGGEIALDLARAGVDAALSVRGPVQVMPRTILGISTTTIGVFQRMTPARLADVVNAPLIAVTTGSLEKIGLRRLDKGPRRLVEEDGRAPIIDIGTLAKIRAGAIKVRGGVARFTREGVVFEGAGDEAFDAVILATGFRPDLRQLLPDSRAVLDERGYPRVSGAPSGEPGLYFCGTTVSPAGQLHEIGVEARRIARLVGRGLGQTGSRNATTVAKRA